MLRKVLFLPSWYPSEVHPVSGIFIREHARAAALHNEVAVLYPYYLPGFGRFQRLASTFRFLHLQKSYEDALPTWRLLYFSLPKMGTLGIVGFYTLAALWGFRKVRNEFQPDIIHANVTLPAGFAAAIIARRFRIPMVLTEHKAQFSDFMKGPLQRWMVRYATRHANLILPVSRKSQQQMQEHRIQGRFEIVPNVVDTNMFCPGNTVFREDDSPKRILMVAMLHPVKGVPSLLQATANVVGTGRRDFVVDIVGDGPQRKEYEGLAQNLGINHLVHFHGMKSKKEVAAFMKRCSFFVLPSLYENLSCVLLEAMACGKPMVVTQYSCPDNHLPENLGLTVPIQDSEALAKAIQHMLDHLGRYDNAAIAQYAQEQFSQCAIGAKLDAVYRRLLPATSADRPVILEEMSV